MGDDDNVCRKHIVIPFTSVNREAWNNFFTICCNGWSEYADYMHSWKKPVIYIGRQGHKGVYSFIIAIGTKDAEGGYFHVYESSNLDTYYDGLKEFETDEDYEYFFNSSYIHIKEIT